MTGTARDAARQILTEYSPPDPGPGDDPDEPWAYEQRPDTGDLDRIEINHFKRQYRNQETARREVRAELAGAAAPDFGTCTATLQYELALPVPPVRWAVEKLATSGSIVTLPSSRKTGKSTFIANLAAAGADSEPFLGAFPTRLDGSIAIINAEMGTWDYLTPYRTLGIRRQDTVRIMHCRDNGIKINLLDDTTADRFAKWLQDGGTRWLFLDPWKNFLAWSGTGLNDNDAANLLITRVQEIHAAAGITLTVIPMHTTQTAQEAGYERAKGAGEVEDAADALWRYVRSEASREAARVLTVEGRGGAGLDETTVDFDAATGRLSLGTGDRKDAQARKYENVLIGILRKNGGITGTKLLDAASGNRNQMLAARSRLEDRGLITGVKHGKSTYWALTAHA